MGGGKVRRYCDRRGRSGKEKEGEGTEEEMLEETIY